MQYSHAFAPQSPEIWYLLVWIQVRQHQSVNSSAKLMRQHALLVTLAEKVDRRDLPSLRLVAKAFHSAVGNVPLRLRPMLSILPSQFWAVCSSFHRIISLNLSSTTKLTSDSLALLPRLTPNLRHLNLSRCRWLDEEGLCGLTALRSLTSLFLASMPFSVCSWWFSDSLGQLTQLRALALVNNPTLNADNLVAVAGLTNLTALYLEIVRDCPRSFSSEELESALSALPGLSDLGLSGGWEWRELSTAFLLSIAVRPNVTLATQAAALDALLHQDSSTVEQALVAAPSVIPQLLGFLEPSPASLHKNQVGGQGRASLL